MTRSTRRLPRRLRTIAAVTAASSLALVTAACGGGGGDQPADLDDLTIVLRNDPDSFDPAITAAETGATQMYEALYDTLIRRDIETGEYTPAMAESWEVTPTRIDFQLKDGLQCADGTELSASDVARSIERLGDPETGSIFTGRVFGEKGFKSATADDAANTVTVEVNGPHTDLLEGLRNAFIICPAGLDDTEALVTDPQGSGPYKLVDMSRGDTYVLERWDSPAVEDIESLPAKITMKVVTSDSTRANLFETGQADIVSVLGRDAKRLEAEHEPILGEGYQADSLTFNQREGSPAADPKVREAIALALSATEYTKAASFDVGKPSDTVITPNVECYDEANASIRLEQDLDAAKAALAEAGYGEGGDQLSLRLVGYDAQNSGPDYVADTLRTIGIDVSINNGTLAQAAGIIYGDKEPWDIVVFPFMTASPIVYPLVTKLSSNLGEGGAYNFGRVTNEEFDRLAAQAPGLEGEERCAAWAAGEAALLERLDVVPLMWPVAAYFGHGVTFQTEHRTIDLRTIESV